MDFIVCRTTYGESQDFRIILNKVLTDMFVYCVFWSAPTTAIFYGWKKAGFVWKGLRELCSPEVLISNPHSFYSLPG